MSSYKASYAARSTFFRMTSPWLMVGTLLSRCLNAGLAVHFFQLYQVVVRPSIATLTYSGKVSTIST